MRFLLLRHGETASNAERRYLGWSDEALSEKGIAMLKQRYPTPLPMQTVFVSPLQRCRQSAKIIFKAEELVPVNALREMNFGDFEGRNYRELNGNQDYQAWIDSGGRIAFPGGESREAFIARVMGGFRELFSRCIEKNLSEAAAVIHGGTIMAILSSLTGEDYFSFQCGCGSGYLLELCFHEKDGPFMPAQIQPVSSRQDLLRNVYEKVNELANLKQI